MSNNRISSTEFTTLCQSQVDLLAKSLGAVWSIVYVAEELIEDQDTRLFPLAIYPQTSSQSLLELPSVKLSEVWQKLQSHSVTQLLPTNPIETDNSTTWQPDNTERKRLILPLVHQETFIGLLVTGREDREWLPTELTQIEDITRTLAIARFLELQYHWSQKELAIQEHQRQIERDRIDTLLHQLRNPLTALRTFSKLLLKRFLPEDRNYQVAQSILEQSDRFQTLLEQFEAESLDHTVVDSPRQLLSISKNIEEQSNFLLPSSSAEFSDIDLQQIMGKILPTLEAIATERNLSFENYLPEVIPQVTGDPSAIREIFNNLLDNALKYTPAGGVIQLNLLEKLLPDQTKKLGIAIADTGYGIPTAEQSRIFERHYRGIQAESDIPGTGLGLAIAQDLVQRMNGEIELISPNHLAADFPGTTFIIWLPAIDSEH